MLQAQVNYWTLQEQKRHNQETEATNWFDAREAQRHNIATEMLSRDSLQETSRHNQETEKLGWSSLNETIRHNQATEYETARHNVATENLGFANLQLGQTQLKETVRHNIVSEQLGWENASIQTQNANSATLNAATNSAAETRRQQEFNWSKNKYTEYEYPIVREEQTRKDISTAADVYRTWYDSVNQTMRTVFQGANAVIGLKK